MTALLVFEEEGPRDDKRLSENDDLIAFCETKTIDVHCRIVNKIIFMNMNAAIGCLTIIIIIFYILAAAFGGPDNDCTPGV